MVEQGVSWAQRVEMHVREVCCTDTQELTYPECRFPYCSAKVDGNELSP